MIVVGITCWGRVTELDREKEEEEEMEAEGREGEVLGWEGDVRERGIQVTALQIICQETVNLQCTYREGGKRRESTW